MGRLKGGEPPDATPLDDTKGLLTPAITTREELSRAEFANINKALPKYILNRPDAQTAPFSYEWLLKLHREMFGEVWEWAGKVRKENLSIGVEPARVAEELARFAGDLQGGMDYKHDPVEISAKIHQRLVWIHPFKNGNGRWARMAANIFLRQRDLPLLRWPEEESVVRGGFRDRYIRALKKADGGDFSELIELHRKLSV